MPVKRKQQELSAEADMTPMIDMTFQLIAFFMVLINFAEDNQDERVKLPSSELAKVPDQVVTSPLVLQISRDAKVLMYGEEMPIGSPALKKALQHESQLMVAKQLSPSVANVIIRGHGLVATGKVQELIKLCQEKTIGFEKFSLRAEQGAPKTDSDYLKVPAKSKMGVRS